MLVRLPRLLVVVVALTALAGCGPGGETFAQNKSANPVVVHVSWGSGGRYLVIAPGSRWLVDGFGHPRSPAQTVEVLGIDCSLISNINGDFSEGGVLTIEPDGSADFVPGRGITEPLTGRFGDAIDLTSCAEAVGAATD
jgi:hypothetical protein